MKYLVIGLSLTNGLWMLIDGVCVMMTGKYVGPEKPGPWASLVSLTGVDVFRLGPVFVLFGVAWLIFGGGVFADVGWSRNLGLVLSVLTLWYLPFGSLISIVVLIALIVFVKS